MKAVHTSALVLIPPKEIWHPIQEIRKQHDRNFRRWMPHVTLIYPFIPKNSFYKMQKELKEICSNIQPFAMPLNKIGNFAQRGNKNVLWAGPEEKENARNLQAKMCDFFREYIEIKKRPFEPHLTIARTKGEEQLLKVENKVQWESLQWEVDRISLIWRNEPPDDIFHVEYEVGLGG